MSETSPFDLPTEEFRRAGYAVVDLIAEHLSELPSASVFQPVPPDVALRMTASRVPVNGRPVEEILDEMREFVTRFPFGNGHPRFYGWVNSPPVAVGVLAEALAAAVNPSVAGGNHAAVWIERQVCEWLKQLFGFPPESMGLLVSGGSSAALTALTVARFNACKLVGVEVRTEGVPATDSRRLRVYKTAEGHGCNQKAVELLGIGSNNIVSVPTDAALRMRPDTLDELLTADKTAGHVPMAVIASAGTVNTGAIDPLAAIADVCAKHNVWFHVDGAYGAPAILVEEYSASLRPISRADSLAVDPHKWMYVPVDAGAVLVKDAQSMRDAFSLVPAYLRTDGNVAGVQGPPWLAEYGFEQTRPYRALKIWAAVNYFGTSGYARLIRQDIDRARHLANRIRNDPRFVLKEPTGLSVVCFRAVLSHKADEMAVDDLNREILRDVQLGGKAFLSGTVIDGRQWLRACVVNPRASVADVDAALDAVVEAMERRGIPTGN